MKETKKSKKVDIQSLKKRVNTLSVKEKQDLIEYLRSSYSIFDEHADVTACRHCGSGKIVKNGIRNGHHRYICRTCKKSFTYRTNTVLSNIQKLNKWNLFVEDFMSLNFSSLKEVKKRIGITEQTAFNWRHKLLSALTSNQNITFENEVIEFDDCNLMLSRKGRQDMGITNKNGYRKWRRKVAVGESPYNTKVLVTYGRNSKKLDFHISNIGRVRKVHLDKYFNIPGKFKDIEVRCDKHTSYRAFFEDNNISYKAFKARTYHRDWMDKTVHVQSANAYIHNFKSFVNEYHRGISTKYIGNYANWFAYIHQIKQFVNRKMELDTKIQFDLADTICERVVNDNKGLGKYRELEIAYGQFLQENGRSNFGKCKNYYYNGKVAC